MPTIECGNPLCRFDIDVDKLGTSGIRRVMCPKCGEETNFEDWQVKDEKRRSGRARMPKHAKRKLNKSARLGGRRRGRRT